MRPHPLPPADRPITKADIVALAQRGLGWEDIMVHLRIMKAHAEQVRRWVLEAGK